MAFVTTLPVAIALIFFGEVVKFLKLRDAFFFLVWLHK
jgi:hypothetical protein